MGNSNKVIEMKQPILSRLRREFEKSLKGISTKIDVPAYIPVLVTLIGITSLMFNKVQGDELAEAGQKAFELQSKYNSASAQVRDLDLNQELIVRGYQLVNNLRDCDFNRVDFWFTDAFDSEFVKKEDVPEYKDPEHFQTLLVKMTNKQRQALVKRQLDLTINDLCKTCEDIRPDAPKKAPKKDVPILQKPERTIL